MIMKISRIYVDTSVFGGCFDPEFAEWSLGLMEDFRRARYRAVVSEVVSAEIAGAPEKVRIVFQEQLSHGAEIAVLSQEARILLDAYRNHEILGQRYRNDMLHIALATVAQTDALVSWNFKHIVRFDKIQQFNGVSLEHGYRSLAIYSPREVTTHGRQV